MDAFFLQQMGQNMVAHRRNYKTVQMIAEILDAIMVRIQGVESDTDKIFAQLESISEAHPALQPQMAQLKVYINWQMQNIELETRKEIQETMEPSLPFEHKKRKLMEVDNFLDAFVTFLSKPNGEEEYSSSPTHSPFME